MAVESERLKAARSSDKDGIHGCRDRPRMSRVNESTFQIPSSRS